MIPMKTRVEGDIYPGGLEFLVEGLCPATNLLYYLRQLLNPIQLQCLIYKTKVTTLLLLITIKIIEYVINNTSDKTTFLPASSR